MGKIRSTVRLGEVESGQWELDADADAALAGWGQWVAAREGWRSSQSRGAVAVDTNTAWLVERVVYGPAFNPRARAILVAHYVHGTPLIQTCRLFGIAVAAYDHALWRAVEAVRRQLGAGMLCPMA